MPDFFPEPEFEHPRPLKIGVLLINLGTPEAPTARALRPYLRQFLSDRRVIEIPRVLWSILLNTVILPFRPRQSAKKYAQIWTAEGSPLAVNTRALTDALRNSLTARGHALVVEYAMRYGTPSVSNTIRAMRAQGVDRLLAIPLYPQYAASSSGSALDAVYHTLVRLRNMPALRTVRHFHDYPPYIDALAQHIRAYWTQHGGPAEKLVLSFHGVPHFTVTRGDPYYAECQQTVRRLTAALDLPPERVILCFQSRFGRTEWLKPYTTEVLAELGRQGCASIDMICPGFVADCLETLEEIAIEGRQLFSAHGGGNYRYIPCLNMESYWIDALAELTEQHLTGWVIPQDANPQQEKMPLENNRVL